MSDVMRTVLFGCLIAAAFSAAGIEIRGANFANWFIAGEPVLFRAKETLPESAKVAVAVFDSAGKTAVRQELSGAVFNREGWRWNAPRPGFYEAEFKVDGETVSEHYRSESGGRTRSINANTRLSANATLRCPATLSPLLRRRRPTGRYFAALRRVAAFQHV